MSKCDIYQWHYSILKDCNIYILKTNCSLWNTNIRNVKIHAWPLMWQNIQRNEELPQQILRHRELKKTKMETTTTMLLLDHDPIILYSIWSRCLILAEDDRATTPKTLRPRLTMYPHTGIYIYPINTTLNMCHKLLYAKIGVLDLCCWNMKKITVELIIK